MIRAYLSGLLLVGLLSAEPLQAQDDGTPAEKARTFPTLEIGAVVGPFSGLSIKYETSSRKAWDFHSSFNADGFVGMRIHSLSQSAVDNSPLTFYLGPGVLGGVSDSAVFLGPAAEAGVFFKIEHYRIVLQLMPEMEVIPHLEGRILAGVGLRIFL
ncbi:MAG: hypothetical protein COV99_08095 [Bacteroidetes bacterium CG12_big_fil_rev_8_21_14_0_65_60_17]|nr:MAG: hypothetical protein COV99_08095 [Bacteroidetes bacterium CG12_big_fil_rev_8_21_14_0_65_60_17]